MKIEITYTTILTYWVLRRWWQFLLPKETKHTIEVPHTIKMELDGPNVVELKVDEKIQILTPKSAFCMLR